MFADKQNFVLFENALHFTAFAVSASLKFQNYFLQCKKCILRCSKPLALDFEI